MTTETLLETKILQKSYHKGKHDIPVLRGIDLKISRGETVAIVGASGAGKSTLMHMLGALDTPSSGTVLFQGRDIFKGSEEERCRFRNRHMGFVFQFHYLLPEFSALENVMMPGLIAGRTESTLRPEAVQLLKDVGLGERLEHKPSELSGGECQRVAVARALMMRPDVILGDELTGNLDAENSERLIDLLLDLNKSRGVTVVVVTHDSNVARRMSRVVEMRDGRLTSG